MNRSAGILLPLSSLPSKYGIGCFSKSAYEFVDWLKEAGQSYWQILPLGPTSYGDSPYQSFSTFAGNPYFISLEALIEEGVLTEEECDAVDFGRKERDIDYEKLYLGRYPLLRKAYERSCIHENQDYRNFVAENSWWLSDYALFMAVKDRFDGQRGPGGRKISDCAGAMPWIITAGSCTLILNSSSICSISFTASGTS